MNLYKSILCILLFSTTGYVFSEGSLQLQPTGDATSYLHISNDNSGGNNIFNNFALYGANDGDKLKVSVSDTSETIFIGVNPQAEGSGVFSQNLQYRIVSPSGVVVYVGTVVQNAEGYIANWNETNIGPRELGDPNGYDAIQIDPLEVGDYVIEFNPNTFQTAHVNLKYFDVTIADSLNEVKLGRLHSQAWQFSTDGGNNPFTASVFPYGPNGIVYDVQFNNMQPYTFTVKLNSTGTGNTGDFINDRKSLVGNFAESEFEVYLNPPDSILNPTLENLFEFEGTTLLDNCTDDEFCLNFSTNSSGNLEGYIDVNGDELYNEADGDIYISQRFDSASTQCVLWDGLTGDGVPADLSIAKVYSSFGYGVTHLPLYDVEANREGFQVSIVRPKNVPPPLVYWDDTNPGIRGTANDGLMNLFGCDAQTSGCHLWTGRGDNARGPETINTWWYSEILYEIIEFDPDIRNPVRNSFNETSLDKGPRVVCPGENVQVFIYDDGFDHYNNDKYKYSWYLGTELTDTTIQSREYQIFDTTYIYLEAAFRFDTTCVTRDSLLVVIVDSVKVKANIKNAFCNEGGAITIDLLASPPAVSFSWSNGSSDTSIIGLSPGVYSLNITDSNFPTCGLDTSFTIIDTVDFGLDSIVVDSANCSRADGSIVVYMSNKNYAYEYSWDGSTPLLDDSILSPVNFGSYDVSVNIENTNFSSCKLDTTIIVPGYDFTNLDLSFEQSFLDKAPRTVCPGDTLSTFIFNSGDHYNNIKYRYNWFSNGISLLTNNQKINQDYFEETKLVVEAKVDFDPTCIIKDSLLVLTTDSVTIDSLVNDVFCINNGSIEINLLTSPPNPVVTWSTGEEGVTRLDSLLPGNYSVQIIDIDFPNCALQANFNIMDTSNFGLREFLIEPLECFDPIGRLEAIMLEPTYNYIYTWDGISGTSNVVENVDSGFHYLHVVMNGFPECELSDTVYLPFEPLKFDIEYNNDRCNKNTGFIKVVNASSNLGVVWSDGYMGFSRQNLSEGTFKLTLYNTTNSTCNQDSIIELGDNNYEIHPQINYEVKNEYRAFENLSFEATADVPVNMYVWQVNSLFTGNEVSMTYLFDYEGVYQVDLYVEDEFGCFGNTSIKIIIKEPKPCGLALPTIFSPNGDTYNDVLNILGEAEDIDLQIYNRWGEAVFRAFDADEYWDGIYRNENASVGVYPYTLTYKCPAPGGKMKVFNFVGDITLVR